MRYFVICLVLLITLIGKNTLPIDESDVFPELVYWSAVKKGNLEKIQFYLDSGYSSSNTDNDNMTPLAYSVKNSNKEGEKNE